jgi:hypothetical protein
MWLALVSFYFVAAGWSRCEVIRDGGDVSQKDGGGEEDDQQ